ncbi:hypothetical protein [Labedaea rhizosphaerae]|uniref:Uncharacterized protein n=1 Tax=Labedaea rhizosphaerae TaxID=598644 RepID=A0A4V3CXJ5_LABRH|nr:hypothetical protein [Labedaea rhizosphaerae]TDP90518.1 hypothetical protein EV186_11058 [Labedaea rhizosphaerae]
MADERTPPEKRLHAQAAANTSWARTPNRAARTAAGRAAADERFERLVDPDGVMDPIARAKAAESARKAHYQTMAAKSVAARRRQAKRRAGTAE